MSRLLSLMAVFVAVPLYAAEPDKAGFVPMFNGKDLDGWVTVNCHPSTFFVKGNEIITTGTPTGFVVFSLDGTPKKTVSLSGGPANLTLPVQPHFRDLLRGRPPLSATNQGAPNFLVSPPLPALPPHSGVERMRRCE